MSKFNDFVQVLGELSIPDNQLEDIIRKNPEMLNANYDEFIININLLYKYNVPKDVIGNLICQNASFLFYDSKTLEVKLHILSNKGDIVSLIEDNPNLF